MKTAFVVEDFAPIAEIWKLLLTNLQFENISIFHLADNIEEKLAEEFPEIILMDINLPGKLNGIEATRKLCKLFPDLKIIIISMHTQSQMLASAIDAGAKGYVVKNAPISEITAAITEVLKGGTYICKQMREA